MFTLDGKVVVITGAASGIGAALAAALAKQGARLMLSDIDAAGLKKMAQSLRAEGCDCHFLVCDAGKEDASHALAAETMAHFGVADVVINNAGVALVAPVRGLKTHDAHWLMNINFWGVVYGCQAFMPQLCTRPEAVLVNISSIFAMVSLPTQSIYNASKAAVRGFSDALREELRGTPVRVLCVHPGGIRTNIVNKARLVDTAMVAHSNQEVRDNFDRLARTTAQEAANQIIAAIQSRKTRLLIGLDAKFFDLLFRVAPGRSSALLAQFSHWARMGADKARSLRLLPKF